ncbi:hypothetical protein B0H67DRAFT_377001 [Lasiosphaeris hirsuta]|uniref:Uncharacterized protein n=1 Tax=Lasiosphaeris hirsuta TaxID=260670 RepID=A0AA40DLK1_9PEZI|nr:hypothetical protein B0H67DRAFT_377001 [Lasiosphaeris hirsuta]
MQGPARQGGHAYAKTPDVVLLRKFTLLRGDKRRRGRPARRQRARVGLVGRAWIAWSMRRVRMRMTNIWVSACRLLCDSCADSPCCSAGWATTSEASQGHRLVGGLTGVWQGCNGVAGWGARWSSDKWQFDWIAIAMPGESSTARPVGRRALKIRQPRAAMPQIPMPLSVLCSRHLEGADLHCNQPLRSPGPMRTCKFPEAAA